MRKKCPYSEISWSVFSRISTKYGDLFRKCPYLDRMRDNTDQNKFRIQTLFTQCLFGAALRWGGGGHHLSKIWHTSYKGKSWHSYTLPKEDSKNIWITWYTPWVLLTSAFLLEIVKFCYIAKYRYRFHFGMQ